MVLIVVSFVLIYQLMTEDIMPERNGTATKGVDIERCISGGRETKETRMFLTDRGFNSLLCAYYMEE